MTSTDAEVRLLQDQMSMIWGNPQFQLHISEDRGRRFRLIVDAISV
jgi:hypothetical protein